MALPTNDDFANCELSIDELEAVAAGWPHWVHSIYNALTSSTGKTVLGFVATFVTSIWGSPTTWFKSSPPPIND